MEGSIDFVQLLNSDLSSKILSNLGYPVDVVRVACVSRSWRHFVVGNGFSKSLCLRLFPETSSATEAIEGNNIIIEPLEVETAGSLELEKLKKSHRVYAFLARGLAPSLTKDCVLEAISASSTDDYLTENIHNTLEPRDRVDGIASYWSSMGERNPEVPETLTYKLVSKLCFITEINIQPFQVFFDEHMDFPICSAKAVRFRLGHYGHTLEKSFQWFSVTRVQVVGRPLEDDFVAELIDQSRKCVLKYYPEPETATCNN
ncbi:hypothetical protein MKW98_029136 [Papaver atlanticum]|uniref:F-box domain-containing protein n=1 Tax=Papaver atlanticum TaxID=357466 RepID=A0AAD4XAE8_9MAGN|nr:hypothetical protein MKW98_029136 [Papaver atlanticum]